MCVNIFFNFSLLFLRKGASDTELRDLLGEIPDTPLADCGRETMAVFEQCIANGLLPAES